MLKPLTIILLLVASVSLHGQDTALHSVKIDPKLDRDKITSEQFDSIYYGLPDPLFSGYKKYVRIYLSAQQVDLYSNDGRTYNGFLLNTATQFGPEKKDKWGNRESSEDKLFYQRTRLDSAVCTKVARALFVSGQDTIPSSDSIKSWERGWLDCFCGIGFSFYSNSRRKSNEYSCVCEQGDTVKYAGIVKANYNMLYKEFNLDTSHIRFQDFLPGGHAYTTGTIWIMYKSSDKENRRYNKAAKKHKADWDYLDSIKDSLNKYLSDTLTKLFKTDSNFDSYHSFILQFSKRNRLIRIISTDKDFIDIGDWIDYHRDKKKIRRAFRKVNASFVKTKIKYWKKFEYYDNKAHIT